MPTILDLRYCAGVVCFMLFLSVESWVLQHREKREGGRAGERREEGRGQDRRAMANLLDCMRGKPDYENLMPILVVSLTRAVIN